MRAHCSCRAWLPASLLALALASMPALAAAAEPLTLRRAVELALTHSPLSGAAAADEQHAIASYREARNNYVPQFILGSGLGASWGFPLSLEGAAPSLFTVNAQSALLNPSLRDFVRAARTEVQAAGSQSRDQRNQVIQDVALSYTELSRWEQVLNQLQQAEAAARQAEQAEEQRIAAGVDNPLEKNKARLVTARLHLRSLQASGSADVLREHLSKLTGLPTSDVVTVPSSIPAFPETAGTADLAAGAARQPAVQAAEEHAAAAELRARGEHRALWPAVDFAAQYSVLSRFNNYDQFFKAFQRNNATIGVAIRLPFLNPVQHAHAQAADAEAAKARKEAESARNQASEETLKLQRSVEQLAAARDVADLDFQVAQGSLDAVTIRSQSGGAGIHELNDARNQAAERYAALQDAEFELEKARIGLLRASGGLEAWAMPAK